VVFVKNVSSSKYALYGLLIILLVLVFYLVRPFITTFLIAAVLAYIFFPVYKLLRKIIRSKKIAALIVVLLLFMISALPAISFVIGLQDQASSFYDSISIRFSSGQMEQFCNSDGEKVCLLYEQSVSAFSNPEVQKYIDLEKIVKAGGEWLLSQIKNFLLSLPKTIVFYSFTLFMMFFLLMDGKKLVHYIMNAIKIQKKEKELLFKRMKNVIDSIN